MAPTPVCTSSTMKNAPCFLAIRRRERKNSGDACLSPPSERMGSMITAATGDVDLLDKNKHSSINQSVNVKLTCQSKSSRTLPNTSSPPLHSLRCALQEDTSKKGKVHWASQKQGCQSKRDVRFRRLQIYFIKRIMYLVDCLTPGSTQATKEASMESRLEGKNRKLGASRRMVEHARLYDGTVKWFTDVLYS